MDKRIVEICQLGKTEWIYKDDAHNYYAVKSQEALFDGIYDNFDIIDQTNILVSTELTDEELDQLEEQEIEITPINRFHWNIKVFFETSDQIMVLSIPVKNQFYQFRQWHMNEDLSGLENCHEDIENDGWS